MPTVPRPPTTRRPPTTAATTPTTAPTDDAEAVKAVVLVGGEGTRLRPLTFTTPKPLLPIANQPHLERQLAWLASHGVDEVVLSMGYLPDAFHAHFAHDGSGHDVFGDVVLRYAVEDEPLGTAGAIRFAADGIDERIVVCNGDVLTDLDLGAMVRFHDEHGAEATISLTQVDDPSAFGVVPTQADGGVIAFVEKPRAGQGAEQLDQRRHLRARAVVPRPHPAAAQRVGRARDVPAHARRAGPAVRLPERRVLARHRNAREVPRRRTPTCSRGRLGRPPAPGAREVAAGRLDAGRRDDRARRARRGAGADRRRARASKPARACRASVLGAGAVVEAGAELDGAVLHDRRRGRRTAAACDRLGRRRATRCSKPDVVARGRDDRRRGRRRSRPGTRISGGRVPAERE